MASSPQTMQVQIDAGSSLSNNGVPVTLPGLICGFGVPSNWTAAALSFQTSLAGGPAVEVLRDGNPYYILPNAPSYNAENKNYWNGVTTIIIRSGTEGSPVLQGQTVLLTISYEPFD